MFSSVWSAAVCGVSGRLICVEADVCNGLPDFTMVGYVSSQVREAQERVRTALRNSGICLEPKRITINLSPADLRKDGPGFDLPIAWAILKAYGYVEQTTFSHMMMAGELSLNGELKEIPGILPMVLAAKEQGCSACILPKANEREGNMAEGMQVVGISNLKELLDYAKGKIPFPKAKSHDSFWGLQKREKPKEDFQDINGQAGARRAAEVAAAGMHNFLMIGPPGSGKSMIARRMPGILPELTREESLEVSSIYSVAGMLGEQQPFIAQRPFRMPHHTVSPQALAGGGKIPKPGEISLAHRGILFLDEMPEYSRAALEILRQPMEERQIRISRVHGTYLFPADFMLVAAMNPCKCGNYPDLSRCTCTQAEIHRYFGKISRPLLDRIDICVEVPPIRYEDLTAREENESSARIRDRVREAQERQRRRYQNTGLLFNSQMHPADIRKFFPLGESEEALLRESFQKLELSARAYHRIIKVARTIADLEGEEAILCRHLAEALCYRFLDQRLGR